MKARREPENGQLEPLEFEERRVKSNGHLVEAEFPAALDRGHFVIKCYYFMRPIRHFVKPIFYC